MTKRESGEDVVGLRAFAREIGVSLASVQKAINAGRITAVVQTPGGRKLRRVDALAQWRESRSQCNANRYGELEGDLDLSDLELPDAGGAALLSPDGLTWGARKTKEEALLAEQRRLKIELERQELEGALHRAEDVAAVWSDILVRFRTRLLGLPAKAAPVIASLGKVDPNKVQAELEGLVREALSELANYDVELVMARARQR